MFRLYLFIFDTSVLNSKFILLQATCGLCLNLYLTYLNAFGLSFGLPQLGHLDYEIPSFLWSWGVGRASISHLNSIMVKRLQILSLNCKGLGCFQKRRRLRQVMKGYDLVCLQETHSTPEHCNRWLKYFGFEHGTFSHGDNRSRGAAVLVKQGTIMHCQAEPDGRIARVTVDTVYDGKPCLITIVSVYAPNIAQTVASREEYLQLVQKVKQNLDSRPRVQGKQDYILVAGDLNLAMGSQDAEPGATLASFELREAWSDLLHEFELVDSFREKFPDMRSYTFAPLGENRRGTFRRLDYIMASQGLMAEVEDVDHTTYSFSDHKAVTLKAAWDKPRGPAMWRAQDNLLKDDVFVEEAKKNQGGYG